MHHTNERLMKYLTIFLLPLLLTACEEGPEACEEIIVPEPFRFIIVDEVGTNQLVGAVQLSDTRIFYLEGGGKVILELDFEGNGENTYGVSPVLSLLSEGRVTDTYLVERGDNLDTLLVQITRQEPGNDCSEFVFNTVTFNGVPATVDTIAEVPVFVLLE